jgi:hypothetical protein
MLLTTAQARTLLRLADGEVLAQSLLSEGVRRALLAENALDRRRCGPGFVMSADSRRLRDVIKTRWGIADLEGFITEGEADERSRAGLALAAADSKALPNNPMSGTYLRTLGRASVTLGGTRAVVPDGGALFVPVKMLAAMVVEPSVIIGVENGASFFNIERMGLGIPADAVVFWRSGWGTQWRKWLAAAKPDFYYAGDYDPAGLAIFEHEVLRYCSDARLLVPDKLAELVDQYGSQTLYEKQESRYGDLHPTDPAAAAVLDVIRSRRKGLEQETLERLLF